jgi:hypothetical protein
MKLFERRRISWGTKQYIHSAGVQNSTYITNDNTKRYVLQNSTCFKTVRVTQRCMFKKRSNYKKVCFKKRYMLQDGISQYGTCYYTAHFIVYCECTKPSISRTFIWCVTQLVVIRTQQNSTNPWISWVFVLT